MSSANGVDFFLDLPEAQGESQQTGFENQIKLLSWSYGGYSESTVGRSSGSGAGKVTMNPINVVAEVDKATTKLLNFLTKGQHLATGTLSAVKNGANNKAFMIIKLTEVFVSGLSIQASDQVPVVSMSLTYKSANTQYLMQTATGDLVNSAPHMYDASTNQTT